ncbi:hypothetical protein C8F01DRAFT_1086868 [Mycena amicta]|nr:hypothetical protein C8F01DRAFT_1086868 [Mycena amicta]
MSRHPFASFFTKLIGIPAEAIQLRTVTHSRCWPLPVSRRSTTLGGGGAVALLVGGCNFGLGPGIADTSGPATGIRQERGMLAEAPTSEHPKFVEVAQEDIVPGLGRVSRAKSPREAHIAQTIVDLGKVGKAGVHQAYLIRKFQATPRGTPLQRTASAMGTQPGLIEVDPRADETEKVNDYGVRDEIDVQDGVRRQGTAQAAFVVGIDISELGGQLKWVNVESVLPPDDGVGVLVLENSEGSTDERRAKNRVRLPLAHLHLLDNGEVVDSVGGLDRTSSRDNSVVVSARQDDLVGHHRLQAAACHCEHARGIGVDAEVRFENANYHELAIRLKETQSTYELGLRMQPRMQPCPAAGHWQVDHD